MWGREDGTFIDPIDVTGFLQMLDGSLDSHHLTKYMQGIYFQFID